MSPLINPGFDSKQNWLKSQEFIKVPFECESMTIENYNSLKPAVVSRHRSGIKNLTLINDAGLSSIFSPIQPLPSSYYTSHLPSHEPWRHHQLADTVHSQGSQHLNISLSLIQIRMNLLLGQICSGRSGYMVVIDSHKTRVYNRNNRTTLSYVVPIHTKRSL